MLQKYGVDHNAGHLVVDFNSEKQIYSLQGICDGSNSISRTVVHLMITPVYSEPGKGTTIRIYLPQHSGETVKTEYNNTNEIPKSHSETILIVEDDISILKLGKKILKRLGYNVLSSPSPNDAILMATEYTGKIQQVFPDLKVLFMSGYTANIISHRGVLNDGVNFISKAFTKKDIAVKIRGLLDLAKKMS